MITTKARSKPKKIALSRAQIDAIVPPESGRIYVYDTRMPGLSLSVLSSGSKRWYFNYRYGGRPLRMAIGEYPSLSIDDARDAILSLAKDVADGRDPKQQRLAKRAEITVSGLWDHYLTHHAKRHKKPSSVAEDQRNWKLHLKSPLGSKAVASVTRADVKRLYVKIGEASGPYAANRVHALLHKMFEIARDDLGLTGENPARLKRGEKYREKSRDRFLLADELPRFLKALNAPPDPITDDDGTVMQPARPAVEQAMRDAIAMMLWTGQRSGNVKSMQWADVDLKSKVWRISGEQTKNGEPMNVVLNAPAMDLLRARQADREDGAVYVFPGRRQGTHLTEVRGEWKAILKAAKITNLRLHDLRRTLGSWQAMGGSSLQIIGQSLGHKSLQATQIYSRLTLDPVRASVDAAATAMLAAASADEDGAPLAKIG